MKGFDFEEYRKEQMYVFGEILAEARGQRLDKKVIGKINIDQLCEAVCFGISMASRVKDRDKEVKKLEFMVNWLAQELETFTNGEKDFWKIRARNLAEIQEND